LGVKPKKKLQKTFFGKKTNQNETSTGTEKKPNKKKSFGDKKRGFWVSLKTTNVENSPHTVTTKKVCLGF